MLKQQLKKDLEKTISSLGYDHVDIVLSIPENSSFGDYSSNVALQLANQNSKNSQQSSQLIANEILLHFGHPHYLERMEVAGPGFLNFFFRRSFSSERLYSFTNAVNSPAAVEYLKDAGRI